jgi:phosphoglycerol transferase
MKPAETRAASFAPAAALRAPLSNNLVPAAPRPASPLRQALAAHFCTLVLCVLILTGVMKLWRADLTVPFSYNGDSLFILTCVKGLTENPWYLDNLAVGMPTGLHLADYPMFSMLHFGVLKLLTLAGADAAVAFNLYFLLTFPLTASLTLLVLRHLRFSYPTAVVFTLLYTFLPFHFQAHYILAGYYCVPLMALVILWAHQYDNFLVGYDAVRRRPVFRLLNAKALTAVVVCLLTASGFLYYPLFAAYLLLIIGLRKCLRQRKWSAALTPACLIGVLALGVVLNALPTFLYQWEHGRNPAAVVRGRAGPEIYGLKMVQLLVPVTGHRLAFLADAKARYNACAPLVNENDSAALGIMGGVGFLLLVGWLLYGKPGPGRMRLLAVLSFLNLFAVLLATIGGFGAVLALVGGHYVRGYNRISIFIGFFALLALGLLFEQLARRLAASGQRRLGYYAFLALVLAVGVYDQSSRAFVPPYEVLKEVYRRDAEFVGRIEAAVPPGGMVFQLPYMPFPEVPPVEQVACYDPFRGYLHSRTLRWSYGAMKGREADHWQKEVAALPVAEQVAALSQAGFAGIYVDRAGYADYGAALERELARVLRVEPLTSADKRLAFYRLAP